MSTAPTAISETAWARLVAEELGLSDERDIERVGHVLVEAGIRPGRVRSPHRLRVRSVYFAGIKHVPDSASEDSDPEALARIPFAFAHEFVGPFTAFATDRVNDAGKSTILGVILWALRGTPPDPTLQADIRKRWLREAAVVVELDNGAFLIHWQVSDGDACGGIYSLSGSAAVDIPGWADAGHVAAAQEIVCAAPAWPASSDVVAMLAASECSTIATFDSDDGFGDAMNHFMMSRLELDSVMVWTKNRQAADSEDGYVAPHGWPSLSHALAIIDPTTKSVLGEEVALTQHLLGVFLGARWSHTVVTARWHQSKIKADISSTLRRRQADLDANASDLSALQDELRTVRDSLIELGDVPELHQVLAATQQASQHALQAHQAQMTLLDVAARYGAAERERDSLKHELHAQAEAAATRRFFHSLRPSCCPRCDTTLDEAQLARERDGHCSVCDSEFLDVALTPAHPPAAASAEPAQQDEDDAVTSLQEQLGEMDALVEQLNHEHEHATANRNEMATLAQASADALTRLDRSSATQRGDLQNRVAYLQGRIAERSSLNVRQSEQGADPRNFRANVFDAAYKLALARRDEDQRATVELVSDTITILGAEFGIRNLERARFTANGHVKVTKGGEQSNFGDLNAGERLRLKIAIVIGLLRAGDLAGNGRHPGLLIVDDLTTHEVSPTDAAAMARTLKDTEDLQLITASTLGPTLIQAAGDQSVVMAARNGLMF